MSLLDFFRGKGTRQNTPVRCGSCNAEFEWDLVYRVSSIRPARSYERLWCPKCGSPLAFYEGYQDRQTGQDVGKWEWYESHKQCNTGRPNPPMRLVAWGQQPTIVPEEEGQPLGLEAIKGLGRAHEEKPIVRPIGHTPTTGFEKDIQRLNTLDREEALIEGAKLVEKRKFQLLVAWLCEGKYWRIPADILAECGDPEATRAVISVLKDSSSEILTRAVAALGPMGAADATQALVDAAQALCAALPYAGREECWDIADALGKIAWAGAAGPLKAALNNSTDSTVRASLARALVRCGVSDGFDILLKGLAEDGGSNDYAGALSALDKEGISDPRVIPEMKALLARTRNINSEDIAKHLLARHNTRP